MGIPERTAIYKDCAHSHAAHNRRSPSSPMSPARSEPQPPPPQQQQQQQHHQQQQQQFDRVPPPPYPGHSKQVFSNMPGFRQSYSGSDTSTDMSLSSTENLASWPRQEPQGEETTPTCLPGHPSSSLEEGGYSSVLTRLQGMTPNGSMERLSASPVYAPCSSSFSSSGHSQSASATSTSSGGEDLSSSSGGGGSRPVQQRLTVPHAWQVSPGVPPPHSGRYFRSLTPTYHHPHPYVNQDWTVGEGGVVSDVYGQSSHVVTYVPFLPPPPEYPGHRKEGEQPCSERKVGQGRCLSDPVRSFDGGVYRSAHKDSGVSSAGHVGSYVASDTIFTALKPGSPRGPGSSQGSADHMVNVLNEENRRLQEELVQSYKKITKLQKLEQEMQQVHEAYQSLVRSTEKRERLEAVIKTRLQEEVKKLQTQNEELKAQVQKAGSARKLRSRSEGRGTQREKESVATLRQLLNERHTKVEQLEFEVEQWEERYRDLQALQYAAREAAESSWCDCSSVMAMNSQKVAQRLEEEAQHDKIQAAEELNQSQKRITELETKVSRLQSQLSQKEHAVKALNHLSQSLPEVSSLPETRPHPRSSSSSSSSPSSHSMGDSSGSHSCCGPSPTSACQPHGGQNIVQLWQV